MKAKVIKTESEYKAALARVDKLMDAKPNTAQGDELELMSLLVHDYKVKTWQITTAFLCKRSGHWMRERFPLRDG